MTANAAQAPDGTMTADLVDFTGELIYQYASLDSNLVTTKSIWVK